VTNYQAPYSAPAPGPVPYSDWPHRAGGIIIDWLPVFVIDVIGFAVGHFFVYSLFSLVGLAVWGYNRWYLGGTTGQSWGRKVLGTRLVSEETGQPIGAGMSFVRDICHFLDSVICYIGWLFPLWDSKRQTLADKLIKTVVVPA
jgi:uncharacterized RDD family membrane protein YckC